MNKLSEISLLLDFYGNLLTEKQRLIMSYHFEEDMSLGEISEELQTSRQAVHDIIKRSEKILRNYEKELGLIQRFLIQKEKLLNIKDFLISRYGQEEISKVINLIDEIMEM
jgi:predicted DNA-binding protein YlxM (UPF0122 family)